MKIYNIKPKSQDFSWGKMDVICLGERGRGRTYTIVPFQAQFEDAAKDYEIDLSQSGKPKIIRTGKPSPGWIARINTYRTYTRGTSGRYEVLSGNCKEITWGHGAFGSAGRLGGWDDVLVVAEVGSIVKVFPSGGANKSPRYYLVFQEEEVIKVPEDEWQVYKEVQNEK